MTELTGIAFAVDTDSAIEIDAEKRTIKGLALPYGVTGEWNGHQMQFAKGVLSWSDPKRIKVVLSHDYSTAVGFAASLEDTDEGLYATLKIARGVEGDRALAMAEDGVFDGLSIGLDPRRMPVFSERDGILHVTSGDLFEISLTPFPAFSDARVTSVAASVVSNLNDSKEIAMTDQVENTPAPESVELSVTVADAIKQGFEAMKQDGPTVVAPVAFAVNEPAPYRFDGVAGAHEFSADLLAASRKDSEAEGRVMKFMAEAFSPKFDVDSGNVAALNPARQRADLYVDSRKYATPFYDALFKGTLTDQTPFVFPVFSSASDLVAPHVEGVEPTPGSLSMTNATVTPSAVSGKVELTREVFDQSGPQVSKIIWDKMTYAYYQALEAKAVALLDAASPTAIALTAGATNATLVNELEGKIAELNFVAGGNVFGFAGTHVDLYKALANAVDSTGRKLLPIINPTNANGQATAGFRSLDVAGTTFTPAWSLGASGTVSESSYLVDQDSVHVWNSAPQRLEFQYRVAYVDIAIWGYVAAAISDLTGVREITYDPTA